MRSELSRNFYYNCERILLYYFVRTLRLRLKLHQLLKKLDKTFMENFVFLVAYILYFYNGGCAYNTSVITQCSTYYRWYKCSFSCETIFFYVLIQRVCEVCTLISHATTQQHNIRTEYIYHIHNAFSQIFNIIFNNFFSCGIALFCSIKRCNTIDFV